MELDGLIDQFIQSDRTLRELATTLGEVQTSRTHLETATAELDQARTSALEYLEQARAMIAAGINESDVRTESRVSDTVASIDDALRQSMEESERRLTAAIDALRDTSRSLIDVTTPLKESAQHLADTATSLRKLEPEKVYAELQALNAQQRRNTWLLVLIAILATTGVVAGFI